MLSSNVLFKLDPPLLHQDPPRKPMGSRRYRQPVPRPCQGLGRRAGRRWPGPHRPDACSSRSSAETRGRRAPGCDHRRGHRRVRGAGRVPDDMERRGSARTGGGPARACRCPEGARDLSSKGGRCVTLLPRRRSPPRRDRSTDRPAADTASTILAGADRIINPDLKRWYYARVHSHTAERPSFRARATPSTNRARRRARP